MKKIKNINILLFLLVIMINTSCMTTVSLKLSPEPINDSACLSDSKIKSLNIKRIAVLDFIESNKTKKEKFYPPAKFNIQPYEVYVYLKNDGQIVANICENKISTSKSCNIVDRRSIDIVLEEQERQLSDLYNQNEVIRIGELLGSDAILTGQVINAYANLIRVSAFDGSFIGTYVAYVTVQFRLVHIESGQIIWNCTISRNSYNYLEKELIISNIQVIKNPQKYDRYLGGSSPEDRIKYVLDRLINEAFENLFN